MNDITSQVRDTLQRVLVRDLSAIRREVLAYPDDESLWRAVPGITNPGGTLALHAAGNIRHFVGAALGDTGYVRNRDLEFSARGLTREQIAEELDDAIAAVSHTFPRLDADALGGEYPIAVVELRVRTGPFLVHLAGHLAYHLGQLDYHRRIVTGSPQTVDTMKIPPVFAPDATNHA